MEAMKRNRSPNYPGIPLSSAVRRALVLYEKTGGQEVNSEIAAKACGFKSLSGASRQVLSAMTNYGLISSKRGKVSTTSRTRALKYKGVGSIEGRSSLRDAILETPLFAELWEKRLTPDEQLVFDLVEGMSFSDAGAKRAIQCFRESIDFAELHSEEIDDTEEGDHDSSLRASEPLESAAQKILAPTRSHSFGWPLSQELSVTVSFTGPPSPDDVDALCDYLEVMKRQLARERREVPD